MHGGMWREGGKGEAEDLWGTREIRTGVSEGGEERMEWQEQV